MSELEDKINSILSDPQEMSKIAGLAQSLMGGAFASDSSPEPEKKEENILQRIMGGFSPQGTAGSNAAMLKAICPYLEEERGRKLERAIRMSEMLKLARGFLKEQGDSHGYE